MALLLPVLPVPQFYGFCKLAYLQYRQKQESSSSPIPLHESVHNNSNILATSFYISSEGNTGTVLTVN